MRFLIICLFLISSGLVAQERKQIKGTIKNILEVPIDGIAVFNNNALEGTVTNNMGIFYLDVKDGDELFFNAVQYDPFSLKITQSIIEKGSMELNFSEGINLLEEVVITDQSIRVAVQPTEMPDTGIDKVSQRNIEIPMVDRIENTFSDRIRQPDEMPLNNAALNQNNQRYYGIDILGFLIDLAITSIFGNDDSGKNESSSRKERFHRVLLKNQYSTEYLVDFLAIPEENLFEFMVYAQEDGLNEEMLKPENEFQLLQVLNDKAMVFKSRLARKINKTTKQI